MALVTYMYIYGIVMMAARLALSDQSLTQQVDSTVGSLPLLDLQSSVQDHKVETFTAPPWEAVGKTKEAQSDAQVSSQRRRYYMTLMLGVVLGTTALGTAIIAAASSMSQQKVYNQVQTIESPSNSRQTLVPEQMQQPSGILQRLLALVLFEMHVAVLAVFMWSAARGGELSSSVGLSWERWVVLAAMASVWMLLQALLRAVWACRHDETFGLGSFSMAFVTYCAPFLSDGFDTCKDVMFAATLQTFPRRWLNQMGKASVAYLAALHAYQIMQDDETEDSVLRTFSAVMYMNPELPDPEKKSCVSWLVTKFIVTLYNQTTRHKQTMLMLEDGPQGLAAIIAFFAQGSDFASFFWIILMNIIVPASKLVFAIFFHDGIAKRLQGWLATEMEVARQTRLKARYDSLHMKLRDLMGLTVEKEQLRTHRTRAVDDNHVRLVACTFKDGKGSGKWIIERAACDITKQGWEMLMVATDLTLDRDLKVLELDRVTNLDIRPLAAAIEAKDCSLRRLCLISCSLGAGDARVLANAISKEDCLLSELRLGKNDIGGDGAKHLARAISQQECGLSLLDLYANQIGDSGTVALAEAIGSQECSLSDLCIGHNKITREGVNAIARAIKKEECQLKHLDISFNSLSEQDKDRLMKAKKPELKLDIKGY